MRCLNQIKHEQRGFSILEIVIALSILGILSFSISNSLKVVDDFDDYQANKTKMIDVKAALITFIQVNGYLPCPDTDFDGREEARTSNICSDLVGGVPYQDLGLPATDVWGNQLFYAVHEAADDTANAAVTAANRVTATSYFNATAPTPVFTYGTEPTGTPTALGDYLKICTNDSPNCNSSTSNANLLERAAVAVVISFGKNGETTWSNINSGTTSDLSSIEAVNADGNDYFWQSTGSNLVATEFDDQLIWLNGYEIKYAITRSGGGLAW